MDRISDRDRAHLRGPVKVVVDDSHQTEYDRQGNILRWQMNSPDGSHYGESYLYDNSRLTSIVSPKWDGSTVEKHYSYDEAGRLLKIAETLGETITFDYDKDGHKIETRVLKSTNEPKAKAIGLDLMFADVDGTSLLDFSFGGNAGSFKTLYNEQDQPLETQAYDAAGVLLGRVLRTFDEKGRITDVKEIADNPISMFPANEVAQMLAGSGISAEEMRAEMNRVMRVFGSESGKSYRYDANGCVMKATVDTMMGSFTRTCIYNEYGDVIEEKTELATRKGIPIGVPFNVSEVGEIIPSKPASEWPPDPGLGASSNIRYSYKYDHHGNWTEKTVTYHLQPSSTSHRELTYWNTSSE